MYLNKTRLFTKGDLSQVLEGQWRLVEDEIQKQTDSYLLNVSETTFVDYLFDKFSISNLRVKTSNEDMQVEPVERDIPAESFPGDFFVRAGNSYRKTVLRIHIPFEGEADLFHYLPNPYIHWTEDAEITTNSVIFERIMFRDDPAQIKQEIEGIVSRLNTQISHISAQVQSFNDNFKSRAVAAVQERRSQLLNKHSVLASIGVPIKKRGDSPATFSVPAPVKRTLPITKPEVKEAGFIPDPTLNAEVYFEILQVLHKAGQEFERHPSLYKDKDEEALRDHLLFALNSSFNATATGETFNKTGKVDILLSYQSKNVFAAECKFWKGPKSYLSTLDQLLGYLTWRDSKAAAIIFVPNKAFTDVVSEVQTSTPNHPNFLKFVKQQDQTWFEYRMHLNGDPNRELWISTLLFHIPEVGNC